MYQENLLDELHDNPHFPLDCSRITQHKQECSFRQFLGIEKLNMSEKERTREESYEDIMKQVHQANLDRIELTKQLQRVKDEIYAKHLFAFQQELQELNEENMRLRKQLQISAKKNEEDRSQRYSNRSPIKMRTSVKSSYANENKKTNAKNQKSRSPNIVIVKKDIKITESTTNLGRSQIQSPQNHKKRESQLTQRKIEDNHKIRTEMSFSILDDRVDEFNIKQSVSVRDLKEENSSNKNIFIQILEGILQQEQQYQQNKYSPLLLVPQQPDTINQEQVRFINQMEGEISATNQKIQMLELILRNYQQEMKELNMSLRDSQEWRKRLWEVKGKYIQMEKKCSSLIPLRKQVQQKQQKLRRLKQNYSQAKEQQKSIPSVQTMIKLLTNPSKTFRQSSKLYLTYYKQIKHLFKYDKQEQIKRTIKIAKVKDTIDSIREGRKKFNELIHIYEGRIHKLEDKIARVRGNNQR